MKSVFTLAKTKTISKWLTNEKNPPVFHGEDYASMADLLTKNAKAFVGALKKQGEAQASAVTTAEGTFTGIEQGDYFHWNMRTKDGEELSFFVLRPEKSVSKVCDAPEGYVGKPCRVTWKASKENIPEGGGTMDIEQVLSVEWLKSKK